MPKTNPNLPNNEKSDIENDSPIDSRVAPQVNLHHRERLGWWLGLAGVIAFSLTLPVTRLIIDEMHYIFIGLGRAAVAGIVATVILVVCKIPRPDKTTTYHLLWVAAGVVFGFPTLSAWAMQTVPASHGGVVLGMLPLATTIAGVLLTDERPSILFWISSILGTSLVVYFSLHENAGSIAWGDVALVGAVILAAIGYAQGTKLARKMAGWQVICWALVISLPITVPFFFFGMSQQEIPSATALSGFLYLALVSQLSGFFLWFRGLALGGIAKVSQTQLLQPFFTIAFAAIILGENITSTAIIFASLVMLSVLICRKTKVIDING